MAFFNKEEQAVRSNSVYASGNIARCVCNGEEETPTAVEAEEKIEKTKEEGVPKEEERSKEEEKFMEEESKEEIYNNEIEKNKNSEVKKIHIEMNHNLGRLKEYLKAFFNDESVYTPYYVNKDLIVVGYNSINKNGDMLLYPDVKNMKGFTYLDYVKWELNEDGGREKVKSWNVIKEAIDKENLDDFVLSKTKDLAVVKEGTILNLPISSDTIDGVVLYTADGKYIGSFNIMDEDTVLSFYDETAVEKPIEISMSLDIAEDKSKALLSFEYDFTNMPWYFGEETLHLFEVHTESGIALIDYTECLEYVRDKDLIKGRIKDIPIPVEGGCILKLITSRNRRADFTFKVDGLYTISSTNHEDKDLEPAKITFGDLPNGILNGTSANITMYSNKKVVMMLNGLSSVVPTTEYTFTIDTNGKYDWVAKTESGVESNGILEVNGFVDAIENLNMEAYGEESIDSLPQTGNKEVVFIVGLSLFCMATGLIMKYKRGKEIYV